MAGANKTKVKKMMMRGGKKTKPMKKGEKTKVMKEGRKTKPMKKGTGKKTQMRGGKGPQIENFKDMMFRKFGGGKT